MNPAKVLKDRSPMADDSMNPPQHQVFISFRGQELRKTFVGFLVKALRVEKVNFFIDENEMRSRDLQHLFKRIEESSVSVVIFSERYTESKWCLDELVKIKEQMDKGTLEVVPIFYELDVIDVKQRKGKFGENFRDLKWRYQNDRDRTQKWKAALKSVPEKFGLKSIDYRNDSELVDSIVDETKKVLREISLKKREISSNIFSARENAESSPTSVLQRNNEDPGQIMSCLNNKIPEGSHDDTLSGEEPGLMPCLDTIDPAECSNASLFEELETAPLFGIEERLEQLEEKLDFGRNETLVVGVVGMVGIGKTTLVKMLFNKWEQEFPSSVLFLDISRMSKMYGLYWLRERLLQELLKEDGQPDIEYTGNGHKLLRTSLLKKKAFVVLDDVTRKQQIDFLLGKRDWIKKGSKIVIVMSDKSLTHGLVNDIYEVPSLNDRDSLQYFICHALGEHISVPAGNLVKVSRKFVDYARGNPLALKALGEELKGKEETVWEHRAGTLRQISNKAIQDVLKRRYGGLGILQKDVFLDLTCFFKSKKTSYVMSLADTLSWFLDMDLLQIEDKSIMLDLADKFLITIARGQVEIHNLLSTFGKELASQSTAEKPREQRRLWNHQDIINVLINKSGTKNLRGIFLDLSKVSEKICLESNTFVRMSNLRYLKLYSTSSHQESKADCKLYFPEGIQLPLERVVYLYWLKFPLEKLPPEFNPKNLIDLKLPYSNIEQVWEGVKDAPKLRWVDLSHSDKLRNLSGLSKAQSIERLNLEGCTSLDELSQDMENMKSLVILNMRGCRRLQSLPKMNLISLKTLILTGCSNLREFHLISENLETLYLDGTAIKELPPAIGNLKRLILLNLKDCTALVDLPDCLGKLKALEDLILSGCSKLKIFPEAIENMEYLRALMLDRTAITQMPKIRHINRYEGQGERLHGIRDLSSLQRLGLSKNSKITCLEVNFSQLYNLKWLDLKYCKNLTSIPVLPPNLQCLDAHGCEKLRRVASPVALLTMTEQSHCTFIFTNCNKLEQEAKERISSYTQWKCHLNALKCYNKGLDSETLFRTCFPGHDVPLWFHHKAAGSVLETTLPPRWCENRFSGIAICAVVSFPSNQDLVNCFSVKCTCEFKKENGSRFSFSCDVGSWTEPGMIESDHVFIGYIDCSNIHREQQYLSQCALTGSMCSLEFKVTDGTGEVTRCGLSLFFAEASNVIGEAKHYGNSSRRDISPGHRFHNGVILAFLMLCIFVPEILSTISIFLKTHQPLAGTLVFLYSLWRFVLMD